MVDHAQIGSEIGVLVNSKQAQYGDSFGRAGAMVKVLYPNGIPLEAYDDALAIIRVVDKLFRIATSAGLPDRGGEDPWRDIAGYALLSIARRGREAKLAK